MLLGWSVSRMPLHLQALAGMACPALRCCTVPGTPTGWCVLLRLGMLDSGAAAAAADAAAGAPVAAGPADPSTAECAPREPWCAAAAVWSQLADDMLQR